MCIHVFNCWSITFRPLCEKSCLRDFCLSKTQTSLLSYRDQLEFSHFLCNKYRIYTFMGVNNKGTDQTKPMRRLVCAFVVYIQHSQVFPIGGPYDNCSYHMQQLFIKCA